jgi:hypothetical protein
MAVGIAISNVVELEVAIEAHKPAGKTEEEFGERWMYIKVIFALDIMGGEFPEMYLVEAEISNQNQDTQCRKSNTHTTWSGLLIL